MTDWRSDLGSFFDHAKEKTAEEKKTEFMRFLDSVVVPAYEKVAEEMRAHGREVTIRETSASVTMIIAHMGEEELTYRVQARTLPNGVLPYAEIRFKERKGRKYISVESMFRSGDRSYVISDITRDEVIQDLISNYIKRVQTA